MTEEEPEERGRCVANIAPEEQAEYETIISRLDAVRLEIERIESAMQKAKIEKRSWWRKIENKYNISGRALEYDRAGKIYEMVTRRKTA